MKQQLQHPTAKAEAPATPDQQIIIGRQPILDRKGNLAGYELLFRSGIINSASSVDGSVATATAINHAFANLGIESVLGGHRGFINFDTDLLMSELIELLPRDKIVIELLETIQLNDLVVGRANFLKREGYMLALDDYLAKDIQKEAVFPYIDIIKVEIAGVPPDELEKTAAALRRFPVRLLAEKVETREQVAMCQDLGFELFQGYYFAKPLVISNRQISPAAKTIIRLTGLVVSDADADKIEEVFRESPDLTISLLRIVNSVAVGARQRITSISHALMLLGRSQLHRWLQVLLYALGDDPGVTHPSPLTILASTRGRFMELLSTELDSNNAPLRERAFMVGMLSLTEAVVGVPLAEMLAPLPLDGAVKNALLARSGQLGGMLTLTEALESSDPTVISDALAAFPALCPKSVNRTQIAAMEWANHLAQSAH